VVVLSVSVDLPETNEAGLKLAVIPGGRPVAVRATVAVEPYNAVTVRLVSTLPPAATVAEADEIEREKSGGELTMRAVPTEWTRVPLVPVIVTV
jgi:hypothetical protein